MTYLSWRDAGRWVHVVLLLMLMLKDSQVRSQVLFSGRCPKLQPFKGFSPKRFLGRWYEIERYFVSYEGLAGSCWVENYLFKKGRGFFTRLDWKDHLTRSIRNIENGITFDKKQPARLRFVVQRPNIPVLRGEYLILATDYDSYALAWQCEDLPLGVGHTEILWYLSKNQFPSYETTQYVKEIAARFGLDAKRLQKQNRKGCPP